MSKATEQLVSVIPFTGLGRSLVYRVPADMADSIAVGTLVRVPLLRRSELGLIARLTPDEDVPASKVKYILRVEQPFPVATPDLIELARWMEVYYAAGMDQVFEVMIPAAVKRGMRLKSRLFLSLARRLAADELAALRKRAPKQAAAYEFFAGQILPQPLQKTVVAERLATTSATLDALVEKGILHERVGVIERNAYDDDLARAEVVRSEAFALNEEQRAAFESIAASIDRRAFATHLLHGVTGSGKTEVYLAAMEKVLDEGGGVIFLVPEVALTPQTVGRLRARLEALGGHRAVVWHSQLSDGERYDAWHAIATGEARVVVGARSAVFAPIANLRLIVVDEEHEPAYKQEEVPRYHGRDTAVYRAFLNKCVCLLGSATPSFESIHNVACGKYTVNHLRKRVDDRQLPIIHVIDMKREQRSKGPVVFSRFLAEHMRQRFERGEQTILFINRRGFDSSLHCPDCGYVAMCDHCDITMTHHRADAMIRCHLCGAEDYVPARCPKCASPKIHYKGSGTQKIEFFARKILPPSARVVRIDADTMRRKDHFRVLLGEFRAGKIDVLVGTQMIAKGLDFPNVTLVGLMDADLSLHLPDFRASERTFQLLVQVAGRAGRGDLAGEVVVQTFIPHDPAIQFGRQQDFDGFAELEMANRREFNYPPYRHLIHHLIRGKNLEKVRFFAEQWVKHLEREFKGSPGFEIRGPAPCPIEKIKDFFRFQVWYFTDRVTQDVRGLQQLRRSFKWDKDIIEVLDVDPMNLI